ncbi:hypothetical protein B296_00038234 [Ensete ventricosum]|uniref:Uncharacterized protein n=1 Tax=Ensete ventricosum TaxID=4639 RepID=A0A426XP23_ENSVE|nr:hypothetical protein B296_00038234 [Ensete ventricosum]
MTANVTIAQAAMLRVVGAALPTGGLLCSKRHYPSGWTGIPTPRVVAPVGTMPIGASLTGWHCPYGRCLLPQAPPLQAAWPWVVAPIGGLVVAGHP